MNAECTRFEDEGLERQEKGESLGAHFDECPKCLEERSAYARLRSELSMMAPAVEPPAGWEERVLAQVGTRHRKPHWARRAVPIAATLALAASVLFIVVAPADAVRPSLDVAVTAGGGERVRGTSANVGDVLQLHAKTGDAAHAELQVFRDERLVFSCGSASACARQEGVLSTELRLDTVGTWEPVLVLSEKPLPRTPPAGTRMQEALNGVSATGARVLTGESVSVF